MKPLTPVTRLGPYEIAAPLGAGGMGDVAVKMLPPGFAANEELHARFEREAQTISSLNRPKICTPFDVEREVGVRYLAGDRPPGLEARQRDDHQDEGQAPRLRPRSLWARRVAGGCRPGGHTR